MTDPGSHHGELERLGRALRTLSGSNRALLRVEDEPALLDEICRVVVEEAGYLAAVVGRAENDPGKTITPIAQRGSSSAYQRMEEFTWADTERGRSATGTAIRTAQPCVINDVENGMLSAHWRDFARVEGFGALMSLPLVVDGRVFGALTILAPEPCAFCELERAPLMEAAEDLSFGLHVLRARARHAAIQETVRRMTLYDPVSDLPNRVYLRGLLAEALAVTKERQQPLALLRIEMERYREIEEALGDEDADKLVLAVAARLRLLAEPLGGTLAHISEAEFALFVPGAGAEQARQLSQRILDALLDSVEIAGLLLDARSCIGVSLFPGHGAEAEILMRRSGIATGSTSSATASTSSAAATSP